MAQSRKFPRVRVLIGALVFISFTIVLFRNRYGEGQEVPVWINDDASLIPADYDESSSQSPYCESHFGNLFLENLSKNVAEYCTPESTSHLTCFSSTTVPDHSRTDVLCIGGSTVFEPHGNKFLLDCQPRELTNDEWATGARPIAQFPTYWYATGPKAILKDHVELGNFTKQISTQTGQEEFSVLIKRDKVHDNMWHSLMEIMATYMSFDVLLMTNNPRTDRPYFQPQDMINTQIVILDHHPDGHFFDLWSLFAKKPPVHLSQVPSLANSLSNGNIIIPLPGGANQFWQGDWEVLGCTDSTVLKAFSRRVLHFYNISKSAKSPNIPLVLTFVNRTTTRKLIDQDKSFTLLREKYPIIKIDIIDYSLLSFAEQLAITRKTDILVGAHGAGLTHGMFLQPGSAMVELMPVNFHHKGFHNLADMLGHTYFMRYSEDDQSKTAATGDWQVDDMFVKPTDFVALVGEAVENQMKKQRG